jgi:superfamily I DNA and/or RNA helicase/very-short-patch-repair endonuclease
MKQRSYDISSEAFVSSIEKLRQNLLDLSGKNNSISFRHRESNKRQLVIVDEVIDQVFDHLVSDGEFKVIGIPIPDLEPDDEKNKNFQDLLKRNKINDETYKTGVEALGSTRNKRKLQKLENDLRDRLRAELGMPAVDRTERPNVKVQAQKIGISTSQDLLITSSTSKKHLDSNLQTLLYLDDLELRLDTLIETNRLFDAETGTEPLFLAIGFLEWFDSENSDKSLYSPLMLLPIKIDRRKSDKGEFHYYLSLRDDEVYMNVSLRERLLRDFGLSLPEIEFSTEEGTEYLSPTEYLKKVTFLIKDKQDWTVKNWATVSIFSFSKMAMYLELEQQKFKRICEEQSPLADIIFGKESQDQSKQYAEDYDIESKNFKGLAPNLITLADTSQISAIIDANSNKNLCIQGPPGTGKSQTITNMIASLIDNGKSVLFVAEKKAALSVVKERLNHAGLGQFCLELHSGKAKKAEVLQSLNERLSTQIIRGGRSFEDISKGIEALKNEIRTYLDFLHEDYPGLETSLQNILWKLLNLKYRNPEIDKLISLIEIPSFNELKSWEIEKILTVLHAISNDFSQHIEQFGNLESHPWFNLVDENLLLLDSVNYVENVRELYNLSQEIVMNLNTMSDYLSNNFTPESLEWINLEFAKYAQLKTLDLDWAGAPLKEFRNHLSFVVAEASKYCAIETEAMNLLSECFISAEIQPEGNLVEALNSDLKRANFLDKSLTDLETETEVIKKRKLKIAEEAEMAKKDAIEKAHLYKTNFESSANDEKQKTDKYYHRLIDQLIRCGKYFHSFLEFAKLNEAFSINGLEKIKLLKPIIANCPTQFWSLKEDSLVDPGTCDLYLQLINIVEELQKEKELLKKQCDLECKYTSLELRRAALIVRNGNIFSWLSSDYRNARKLKNNVVLDSKAEKWFEIINNLAAYKEKFELLNEKIARNSFIPVVNMVNLNSDVEAAKKWVRFYQDLVAWHSDQFFSTNALAKILSYSSSEIKAIAARIDDSAVLNFAEYVTFVDSEFDDLSNLVERIDRKRQEEKSTLDIKIADFLRDKDTKLELDIHKIISTCEDKQVLASNEIIAITNIQNNAVKLGINRDIKLSKILNVPAAMIDLKNAKEYKSSEGFKKLLMTLPDFQERFSKNQLNHAELLLDFTKLIDLQEDELNSLLTKSVNEWIANAFSNKDKIELAVKKFNQVAKNCGFCQLEISKRAFSVISERLDLGVRNSQHLSGYLQYCKTIHELGELKKHTEAILTVANKHNVLHLNLKVAFEIAFYTTIVKFYAGQRPKYFKSVSSLFDEYRAKFKVLDDDLQIAYQVELSNKLSRRAPPAGVTRGKVKELTEMGLINNLKPKSKISLRDLLYRAPQSLQTLKPVFMMSPLSVAQLLPEKQIKFDVVIMDEASQMRPEDAVGSIARARQVIIVGDPKQMPPSDFFAKSAAADDSVTPSEDDFIDSDAESILDQALGAFRPARRLRWHYRSRHEELIAFSNRHFYDNDLIVFPSSKNSDLPLGIKFDRIEGIYGDGLNNIEARAAVDTAVNLIKQYPNMSLMIVAMNKVQSELIQELFNEVEKTDIVLQEYIARRSATLEPFQIRNLENVQGDERDIIVISTVYGKDSNGNFRQSFGPINSKTGDRRLNVLFTRAKYHMRVVSSLDPDWITIDGAPQGRIAFKNFLNYSKTKILGSEVTSVGEREPDSEFEKFVAKRLQERMPHLKVVHQVGVSGYFIDLGVIHPEKEGAFVLGIECDGKAYHSAKSARDRDKIRQKVLEDLGWKIHRVWSTDWFHNPDAQISKLVDKINFLLKAS